MAKNYDDSEGRWVTISGRKVFIAEGQSLGDAMKKSGKFKNVKEVKSSRRNNFKDEISQGDKNKFAMGYGLSKDLVKGYAKARQDENEENQKRLLDLEMHKYTSKEKLERAKEKLESGKLTDFEKKYYENYIEKREGKSIGKMLEERKNRESSKNSYTRDELKSKYGTDNVDLINAGKEKENRVSLSEKQVKEGNRLNEKSKSMAKEDIQTYLGGNKSNWDNDDDFVRDLANEHNLDYKEAKKMFDDANKNSDKQESSNSSSFTQKTDMHGGTYEYSKEQLDRMQEGGMKPMEHSYTGGGWEGTKYDSNLSTKDIAKNINDYAKKEFPDVKLSRKTDYNGIDIHVMSSDKDLYASASDIDKMSDKQVSDTIRDSIGGYTRMDDWLNDNNRKSADGTFTVKDERDYLKEQLNTYKSRKGDNVSGNEWYLSDYGKKVISGLNKEMNSYNYDDSDGMVDYFNTNFYGYVHIGKWDKPYESKQSQSPNKSMNDTIREKAGKTKADRNIDTFDDDNKKESQRRLNARYDYNTPGKIGNMKTEDFVKQRNEFNAKADKLWNDNKVDSKQKKISDDAKSGKISKQEAYKRIFNLHDDNFKQLNQISKNYDDEVVASKKPMYSERSNVIKRAMSRMSDENKAKTRDAREELRKELNESGFGKSIKNAVEENKMFKAWQRYRKSHPNSDISLTSFKQKYKG